MDFIIGCNYWASNAGTEMWKNWDYSVVKNDIKHLAEYGITHLRVFPNWRDFQPIIPMMEGGSVIREYCMENDQPPENKYYLSERMLDKFECFCDICEEYSVKLIVGLLTGWMSGRMFVPSALFGKNLYTDSTALLFEQRFVMGFVSRFKGHKAIYAWDLGNECNAMGPAEDRFIAMNWTCAIANAIKSQDDTRPIISGMHSLSVDECGPSWSIQGQSEFTDVLTTHPYPFWVKYAGKDEISSYRTSMHATAQTKLYSDIGEKPCLVEELGTMGPMICSDEVSADFIRCNLFSNFANGATGVMWWCANEQTNLTFAPYKWNMCEVELGLLDKNMVAKPVLSEMKAFSELIKKNNLNISVPKEDAICVLTESQEHWGVAYMTYCLAKQCDMNIGFRYCHQDIPDSDIYLMPSINMHKVIPSDKFNEIKSRVYDKGATLFISNDCGILSGFNDLTGLKIIDSSLESQSLNMMLEDESISFKRERKYRITSVKADVIAYDDEGNPAFTVNKYGKGKVFYVNFPLEKMLLDEKNAFDSNRYKVYKYVFAQVANQKNIISDNQYISLTEHIVDNEVICIAINHSNKNQKPMFNLKGYKITEVVYGNLETIKPFDAIVFKIVKNEYT